MNLDELLPQITGPFGALVLALVVLFFLYRLYREERRDAREDRQAVFRLTGVVEELVQEVRALREARR